jgi:hypothetical protein
MIYRNMFIVKTGYLLVYSLICLPVYIGVSIGIAIPLSCIYIKINSKILFYFISIFRF